PQEVSPGHGQGASGGLARRLHGRGRPRAVHRPQLSGSVLEQGGVRVRADGPPRPRRLVEPAGGRCCGQGRREHHGRGRRVDFAKADEKDLVATLSHENMWQRMTAQLLLVERGKTDVVPQLTAVVKDGKSAAGAFHALWTMHGLGAFTSDKGEAIDAAKAGL